MIMRELSKNEEEVQERFDVVADAPAKILREYSEILRNGWREKRGRRDRGRRWTRTWEISGRPVKRNQNSN